MANEFFTILTATGKAKLAAAQTSGTPLQITQMAVGDGDNGAYYNPIESQTALKHETWRGALNNLSVDQTNPNWIVAELVIPDTVGGFYIREVGLLDSTGALIAVGKFPESYKPTLAAGSNKQLYVRMILEVSNASAVTLLVDPSVVLATRATVDQRIAEELAKLDGKPSVKVATTAAIALTGLQTIDGVVLAAGDRVLVKDQAAAKDNGIYVVAAGAWARAADADASIEVTPGLFVSIEQGTANADSIWQLVTDGPITLGSTGLAFERVSGKTGITTGSYNRITVGPRGEVLGGSQLVVFDPSQTFPVQVFRKNLLINGNFDIWQRGNSLAAGSNVRYLADRWLTDANGSTITPSRQAFVLGQTDVPGEPTFYHRCVVASSAGAANFSSMRQHIEGARTLAGKSAMLTFYAKADANKNLAVEFNQFFGTGGAPSSVVAAIGTAKLALTANWQKFTIPVTFASLAGKTLGTNGDDSLRLQFWFEAGSNYDTRTGALGQQSGTFDIAQVQLEEGTVATPFDWRPPQSELALCQRYAWVASDRDSAAGAANSTSSVQMRFRFPVPMRTTPAVSVNTAGSWALTNDNSDFTIASLAVSLTSTGSNQTRVQLSGASGLTTGATYSSNAAVASGSARILFDAEL